MAIFSAEEKLLLNKNKKAFTLAEVLITLGVIGIVAAMTLPTVIQNYQEKAAVTKLKKMYSTLQQAYLMNKALDEIKLGQTQATNAVAAAEVAAIFVPYLHISRDCGTDKPGCVYSGYYKAISGTDKNMYEYGGLAAYRVILNDGSSIWFRKTTGSGNPATIFYDINGENPPNVHGKDLFRFEVVNDRILPEGMEGTNNPFDSTCSPTGSGYGCTAWVIQQENFEYLKCSGLKLNGPKKKCN